LNPVLSNLGTSLHSTLLQFTEFTQLYEWIPGYWKVWLFVC